MTKKVEVRWVDRREFLSFANLGPTEAKCLMKILLIAMASLITVFPTLKVSTKLIGLAFVDFRPIMLFIPSH